MSLSSTKEGQKVALTLLKKVRAILDDAQQTDKITTMQTAIKQAATGAWVTFGAIRGMGHLRWGGGILHLGKGAFQSPRGAHRLSGALGNYLLCRSGTSQGLTIRRVGWSHAAIALDCSLSALRQKEDPWNSIMSARPPVASSLHVPVHVPWRAPQSWAGLYSR